MNVNELAASAIRAVHEINFILRNFDANGLNAVSELDQVCSHCAYLAELELKLELRGGNQGRSEVAGMIAVLRIACETMARDAYVFG